MSDMSEFCTELMHWLDGGRSPWHTVAMAEQALTAQGFTPLELGAPFAVKRGGRYFVSSGTFLAAITVGARDVFRIAASHTDWPCMRIKPQPELVSGVMEEQCADELRTFFRELRKKRKLIRKAQKSEEAAAESGEAQQDAFCEREK